MTDRTMHVVAETAGDNKLTQIIAEIESQTGRVQSARSLLNLLAEEASENFLLCGSIFTAANALESIESKLDAALQELMEFENMVRP